MTTPSAKARPMVLARRALLRALPVLASAPAAGLATPRPSPQWIELMQTEIVGSRYYELRRALPRLQRGDRLIVQREPHNPYDDKAIEVYAPDRRKLGYLPRRKNEAIAALMDARKEIAVWIVDIDPDEYDPLWVSVNLAE